MPGVGFCYCWSHTVPYQQIADDAADHVGVHMVSGLEFRLGKDF